jgi:hypothetical protein
MHPGHALNLRLNLKICGLRFRPMPEIMPAARPARSATPR